MRHTHTTKRCNPIRARQAGSALIISLVFLLILTILGVTAVTTSTLQQRMAGNLRDESLAATAGDSAMRQADSTIKTATGVPSVVCGRPGTGAVWDFGCAGDIPGKTAADWVRDGNAYTMGGAGLASNPYYITEFEQQDPDTDEVGQVYGAHSMYYYRSSSRAEGASANATVLLQDTFRRRFDD